MFAVGVDNNVRELGVAVLVRGRGADALKILAGASVGVEVLEVRGYFYAVFKVRVAEPFLEYVEPLVDSLARKYAEELEVLSSLGLKPLCGRFRVPGLLPEYWSVRRLVDSKLAELGLREVPWLFSVELSYLLRRASATWTRLYKIRLRNACSLVAGITSRLSRIGSTVVKIEDLSSINRKASHFDKTKRWAYSTLKKILLYSTSRRVKVYEVDPAYTSTLTPCCRARARRRNYKTLICPKCGKIWDRDIMAAINIIHAPVKQRLK